MKYLLKITAFFLLFSSCQKENQNQNKNIAIVEGATSADFKNQEFFLQYIQDDSLFTKSIKVDSDGKFKIELDSIDIPKEAILISDTTNYTPKVNANSLFYNKFLFQFGSPSVPALYDNKIDFKMFLLEEGRIQIKIQDSIYNSSIGNSQLNDELIKLEKKLHPVMNKYNDHTNSGIDITKIQDFKIIDSLTNAYSNIWQERKNIYAEYILQNPHSQVSLFALKYTYGGVNVDVVRLYETLGDSVKATGFGLEKSIVSFYERMNKQLTVKSVVPNFKLKDVNEEEIALYDIKSKFILLDFWASWCAPCRKENKIISEFYDAFEKSDFQMVAVSVDDKEEKWKKAIIEDKANWISLWDEDKKINDEFGVVSYPTNFLLNDKFEVVATQLKAEELQEQLRELLE